MKSGSCSVAQARKQKKTRRIDRSAFIVKLPPIGRVHLESLVLIFKVKALPLLHLKLLHQIKAQGLVATVDLLQEIVEVIFVLEVVVFV